jgi:rhodanese-related sulfurtransferase
MTNQGSAIPIEISFESLASMQKPLIIDCRTTEEFEEGHLEHAINIPLQHLSLRKDDFPCECSDALYVYCKSGNRSGTFAVYLRTLGFTKCQSIAGGYESWRENNEC